MDLQNPKTLTAFARCVPLTSTAKRLIQTLSPCPAFSAVPTLPSRGSPIRSSVSSTWCGGTTRSTSSWRCCCSSRHCSSRCSSTPCPERSPTGLSTDDLPAPCVVHLHTAHRHIIFIKKNKKTKNLNQ